MAAFAWVQDSINVCVCISGGGLALSVCVSRGGGVVSVCMSICLCFVCLYGCVCLFVFLYLWVWLCLSVSVFIPLGMVVSVC